MAYPCTAAFDHVGNVTGPKATAKRIYAPAATVGVSYGAPRAYPFLLLQLWIVGFDVCATHAYCPSFSRGLVSRVLFLERYFEGGYFPKALPSASTYRVLGTHTVA